MCIRDSVKIVSDFNMENPVFLLYGSWAERVGIEYARLFGRTRHTQGDIHDFLNLKNVKYSLKANPEFKRILDQNGLEKKGISHFKGVLLEQVSILVFGRLKITRL